MIRLGGHIVLIAGPVRLDRHGDPLDQVEHVAVPGCHLQFLSTEESFQTPEGTVTVTARLFAPPGAPVHEGGRVVFRDEEFRVVGRPFERDTLTGHPHHIEARLREVRGV